MSAAAACAQAVVAAPGTTGSAVNDIPERGVQRSERLHTEDAGSRIDEERYGGQTRSITVQSKEAPVPPYQVRPAGAEGYRSREAGPGSTGPRTWKILDF